MKHLLSICLFCCFLPDASAQNDLPAAHQPSPKFSHFTTAEGLPSNFEIYSMTTDAEGFLWVGTKEGLARFDGRRFMPFNEMQPRHPLPEEPVQYVFADRQGRLWVRIGNEGIYSIDLVTFQTRFFKVPFWEDSFEPTACRTVEDTDGNLWFCSPGGIALLERGAERFSFFPWHRDGAPKQLVRDLCLGQTGEMWVATQQGLFCFDTRKRQFEQQPTGGVSKRIVRIACDHEGLVWMSSWYNPTDGFTVFDPRLGKIIRTFSQNPNDPTMPANTDAWDIYPVGDTIWFATNSGGLCAFDKKRDCFFSYLPELGNPASIASNQVIGIHLDQSGNLWTSNRHQLSQLPAYRKTTELLTQKPGVAHGLIGSLFETVEALPDGLMAIGAEGGVNFYDPVAHRTANFTLPNYNGNVANNCVLSFANADAQTVWVGTWAGLHRMDKRNGQLLTRFVTALNAGENHPLSVKRTRVGAIGRLLLDRHGVLWVISIAQYLRRLKKGTHFEYLATLHTNIGPLIGGIHCLLEQDEQRVFLGSDKGLLQFNQQDSSFQAVPLLFSGEQGRLKVTDMAWSKNGDLLAIVNDKIWRIDLHTYTARRITPTTPMRNCLGIIEDQIGNIWICTEHGLTQISPDGKRSRTLDAKNFLHGNTFTFGIYNFKIAAQGADGRLYFAGTKGVTMLRPKDWTFEDEMLEAKIISLKINNLLADLDTVIHKTHRLQLPYEQNDLSFQFAVPNAAMPQIARFAYRLQQDEEWVDIGTQNTLNLSSLSPGNYVLEVRAASYDGLWSEKPARLYFTILPPWWRSWWAFVLYTLTIFGVTYWFYKMRLRQKLERQEAQRLQQLDTFKTRFFANISHEFRTPLTMLIGPAENALNRWGEMEPEMLRGILHTVRRNGYRLLNLVNQLLDLSRLEAGKLRLSPVNGDLVAFLRYQVESCHSYAETRHIQMGFKSELPELPMAFDQEKIQTIVVNLLSNALKFTPDGGRVTVEFGMQHAESGAATPHSKIHIRVSDTGQGIPARELSKIFDRFYQVDDSMTRQGEGTGIGLALVQELVKLMQGSVAVESTVGVGTTFQITLPYTPPQAQLQTLAPPKMGSENFIAPLLAPLPPAPAAGGDGTNSSLITHRSSLPHLLIIEDSPDLVAYLQTCLEGSYQLDVANNGKIGIEKALETIPDLIISDVMMPEKNGYEVCDTLKHDERTSHIPIVLLTAKADMSSKIAGLRRGADAYLPKPFHLEELLVQLETLVERQKRMVAHFSKQTAEEPLAATPEQKAAYAVESAFMQKVRLIIEENLADENFALPQLCEKLHMSRSQLFRKMMALADVSPSDFIRSHRLQKAKSLLETADLTVSEVAWQVGYKDVSHFSKSFQEMYGVSPSSVGK